jgi:hypothetical protein
MSLIRRHTDESCRDLYRGSALAGMEVEGFGLLGWPKNFQWHTRSGLT